MELSDELGRRLREYGEAEQKVLEQADRVVAYVRAGRADLDSVDPAPIGTELADLLLDLETAAAARDTADLHLRAALRRER